MQVFKAYFKIMRKHKVSLLIYLAVFFIVSVLISSSLKGQTSAEFNEAKSNVAIINEDGDSAISKGLTDYLSSRAVIVPIRDDAEDIQDALFYGNVDYVLRIPKGFAQGFMSGDGSAAVQKTVHSTSAAGVDIDIMVNKYLNMSALYANNVPSIKAEDISANVLRDLKITSQADFAADEKQTATDNLSLYFQIIAYSILAMMITGVTTTMMSFNEKFFSMRNKCSPISIKNVNLQMVLANAFFALAVWVLMCLFTFIMYGQFVVSAGIALLCLNALVFTVASLGIGFLAGKFVKNNLIQSAVTNVVSLGMSFISGVFVSQHWLSASVQKIASFTPAYWYIKAVDNIKSLPDYSSVSITPALNCMLIELGFAAAFIVLALALSKKTAD
jgi:ABC-2 type transport system permease protein